MSYQEQAYLHVKTRILQMHYKPNEYISDRQIAEELKISRTPVRDAFTRLECEGLLVNEEDRRGWRVYTLTLQDIQEIFDIKKAIEGMIVVKAAACADEALRAELRSALADMQAASERADTQAWLQSDAHLHETLARMADNNRAQRVVEMLNAQWHRIRLGFTATRGRMSNRAYDEHAAFVSAVLAGDAAEAEHQLEIHMNRVHAELVDLLVNMVMPYAQNGV
jgi:GntR family transcriptional regulator, rspAB operon transcriptional repressor